MQSLYTNDEGWRFRLNLAQGLQAIDVLFAALRMTPNNPATVSMQIASRLLLLAMFALVPLPQVWAISLTAFFWSLEAVIRYPFYTVKSRILSHLRYNMFLVCYPLGVFGEMLCVRFAQSEIGRLPEGSKPYTVRMPNMLNVSFDANLVINLIYLSYVFGFPHLFFHMLRQRTKFYAKVATE